MIELIKSISDDILIQVIVALCAGGSVFFLLCEVFLRNPLLQKFLGSDEFE